MTEKQPTDLAALADELAGSPVRVKEGTRPIPKSEPKPKPESAPKPAQPRAGSDVAAAVTALDQLYGAVQLGLMMMGAHKAAINLQESLPGLREQNTSFLSQDKEMAKRIAGLGKTGGRFGFFAAQAMVFGPVGVLAVAELSEKRKTKRESEDESNVVPLFPGGVFDES